MDLQSWRKHRAEGEPHQLPSGLVVHLRRVQLLDLVEAGSIPAPLMAAVNKLLGQDQGWDLTADNYKEFAGPINALVKACVVSPQIADEPDEEHLGILEIPVIDKIAIYEWAFQPVEKVRPFLPEREQEPNKGA